MIARALRVFAASRKIYSAGGVHAVGRIIDSREDAKTRRNARWLIAFLASIAMPQAHACPKPQDESRNSDLIVDGVGQFKAAQAVGTVTVSRWIKGRSAKKIAVASMVGPPCFILPEGRSVGRFYLKKFDKSELTVLQFIPPPPRVR